MVSRAEECARPCSAYTRCAQCLEHTRCGWCAASTPPHGFCTQASARQRWVEWMYVRGPAMLTRGARNAWSTYVASKNNEQKILGKKICCCHLEGHWRKSQDPELDPDSDTGSCGHRCGSGSGPKCHGSAALLSRQICAKRPKTGHELVLQSNLATL